MHLFLKAFKNNWWIILLKKVAVNNFLYMCAHALVRVVNLFKNIFKKVD